MTDHVAATGPLSVAMAHGVQPPPANDREHPAVADFAADLMELDAAGLRGVIAAAAGLLCHRIGANDARLTLAHVSFALQTQAKAEGLPGAFREENMRSIVAPIAARHGLTLEQLRGPSQTRRIAWPRQEAMHALKAEDRWTLTQIGRYLGGRDHTTVIHGARKHQDRVTAEAGLVP